MNVKRINLINLTEIITTEGLSIYVFYLNKIGIECMIP